MKTMRSRPLFRSQDSQMSQMSSSSSFTSSSSCTTTSTRSHSSAGSIEEIPDRAPDEFIVAMVPEHGAVASTAFKKMSIIMGGLEDLRALDRRRRDRGWVTRAPSPKDEDSSESETDIETDVDDGYLARRPIANRRFPPLSVHSGSSFSGPPSSTSGSESNVSRSSSNSNYSEALHDQLVAVLEHAKQHDLFHLPARSIIEHFNESNDSDRASSFASSLVSSPVSSMLSPRTTSMTTLKPSPKSNRYIQYADSP